MAVMTRGALCRRMDAMRRKYGIRGPFDPYAFARAQGITVTLHRFSDSRLRGILVHTGGRCGVILGAHLTSAGRRVTLAHELVHYELHRGESTATFRDSPDEYQADEGAAELLMPYRDFIPRASALRRRYLKDPTGALRMLAARYKLDLETVRRRLVSLEREILLYRHGTPLSDIVPLSFREKAREAGTRERFGRPLRAVRTDGLDIYPDQDEKNDMT